MNLIRTWVRIITVGLAGLLLVAHAETEALYCGQRAYLAGQGGGEQLKYAPDPGIQMLHLAIDVTPDFKEQGIEGKVTLRFKPTAQSFQELRLDGVDLLVHSVTASEKIMGW